MNKAARWLPALVVSAVVAAGAVALPAVASASSAPPARTPEQVLALVAGSTDVAYSGTLEQTSDLGLPQLPTSGPGASSSSSDAASALELVTAPHTARVFADGPTRLRVQVLDSLAERDVVRNGSDVWLYSSRESEAAHVVLPSRSSATPSPEATTPADLARRIVSAIEPSTRLAVSGGSVAGRSAYELTLTPGTSDTLVGHVTLSVDAATGLPLRVAVTARGHDSAAFSIGFRSIDVSAPSAETFRFTPPAGTRVTTPSPAPSAPALPSGLPRPAVLGSGWTSILELPAGTLDASDSAASPDGLALLDQLTTPVAGGRALHTSLVSVLLTSDGRVLAGSVPVETLESAAR